MRSCEGEATAIAGFVDQERSMRSLASTLRVEGLSPAGAEQIENCLIAIAHVTEGMRLLVAERSAETGSWRRRGFRSPEEDLARRSGTSTREAKETIETSKQVRAQPRVENALRTGKLSKQQAAEVSRAAKANPDAESKLVDTAGRTDMRGLRDECRKAIADADDDREATNRRLHNERFFRHGHDAEGALTGSFKLTPQAGATFLEAFSMFRDQAFKAAKADNRWEPDERIDADALVAMATASTATGDAPAKKTRQVNVLVDRDALLRGHTHEGDTCDLDGIPVPVSVVRDILDDAFLVGLLMHGDEVTKVERFGRHIPAAIRDALRVRDNATCSVEGCSRNARLQMDHIHPVGQGGVTALGNLQLLCDFHHKQKTANDRLFPVDRPERHHAPGDDTEGPDPPDTG